MTCNGTDTSAMVVDNRRIAKLRQNWSPGPGTGTRPRLSS